MHLILNREICEFKDGVPSSGRWAAMPMRRNTDTNLLPDPFFHIFHIVVLSYAGGSDLAELSGKV